MKTALVLAALLLSSTVFAGGGSSGAKGRSGWIAMDAYRNTAIKRMNGKYGGRWNAVYNGTLRIAGKRYHRVGVRRAGRIANILGVKASGEVLLPVSDPMGGVMKTDIKSGLIWRPFGRVSPMVGRALKNRAVVAGIAAGLSPMLVQWFGVDQATAAAMITGAVAAVVASDVKAQRDVNKATAKIAEAILTHAETNGTNVSTGANSGAKSVPKFAESFAGREAVGGQNGRGVTREERLETIRKELLMHVSE